MVWLSILGGVCNRISARERENMSRTTDRAGRNKGQWIVIGFMAFAIIVISICTVIFRSYVRGFHKVTDREKYDRYYVMITEDRKSDFWQSVYRGAFERGQEENVYVDLLGEHLSQEYTRAELMRIAMSSGVDGIFVESDESDEMSQMIDEAVERVFIFIVQDGGAGRFVESGNVCTVVLLVFQFMVAEGDVCWGDCR